VEGHVASDTFGVYLVMVVRVQSRGVLLVLQWCSGLDNGQCGRVAPAWGVSLGQSCSRLGHSSFSGAMAVGCLWVIRAAGRRHTLEGTLAHLVIATHGRREYGAAVEA
jgi:hypothetical protein